MNTFNRFVVVLDILLTMAVVIVLLVFPGQSLNSIYGSTDQLIRLLSRVYPPYLPLLRIGLVAIAVVVDFLLLLLLVAEFRGPRRKMIRVQSVSGGEVSVAIASIADRLRYHIDPLPDVLSVKPRVSAKSDGVALSMEVKAASEINVPHKAEEILEITRQVIEEKMGLKLAGTPQILIRTVYPSDAGRRTAPTPTVEKPSVPSMPTPPAQAPELSPPGEAEQAAGDQL